MPSNVTMYNLLISCPGDIQAELDIIQEAVEQFNQQFSATLGIAIQTKHWSKSAYSQSGAKPQALLNKQIVDECDAAVALFWTRFGTPTDKYQSGAEEEIELMLAAGKQVFMYFCEKPIDPKKIDMNQYNKVQTFRDAYKDRGLYYTYSDDEAFRKMFFAHLTMHFMTVGKAPQAIKDDKKSILKLKSAIGSEIRDLAIIQDFALGKIPNRDDRIKEIRKCYDEALGCSVTHHSANGLFAGYNMNSNAKHVLFTATPFRLDKKEIKGDIIYNYPFDGTLSYDKNQIVGVDWDKYNTDVKVEFIKNGTKIAKGKKSIQDTLREILLSDPKNKYVLYDHGTGEMADYITIQEETNQWIVKLYHVKKKSAAGYNNSMNDAYEVAGQAVKSIIWLSSTAKLIDKIRSRQQSSHCVPIKGDSKSLLKELRGATKQLAGYIVIVQPGLSKSTNMSIKVQEVLASASLYIARAGRVKGLEVMGSL